MNKYGIRFDTFEVHCLTGGEPLFASRSYEHFRKTMVEWLGISSEIVEDCIGALTDPNCLELVQEGQVTIYENSTIISGPLYSLRVEYSRKEV